MQRFVRLLHQHPDFVFLRYFQAQFPQASLFVVGGAVRDILLGKADDPDIDLLVRGTSAARLKDFLRPFGDVEEVGKHFGVLKFRPQGSDTFVDIALPRTEEAGGSGARRDFAVQSDPWLSVEEDLARRDFTINAIAVDVFTRKIIDPFGGIRDIRYRILRTVGDPQARFAEDYSRLVRALRFSITCSLVIEQRTYRALQEIIARVFPTAFGHEAAIEVITSEFLKAFHHTPVETLDLFEHAGILAVYLPEVVALRACTQPQKYHSEGDVLTHTKQALASFSSSFYKKFFHQERPLLNVLLAVLFHDIGKPAKKIRVERNGETYDAFYGHEVEGEKIFRRIAARVAFASYGSLVDVDYIAWLIRNHMLPVLNDMRTLRPLTVEQYFFNPRFSGKGLLEVYFADSRGSTPASKDTLRSDTKKLRHAIERFVALRKKGIGDPPLLTGTEVMDALGIASGPEVGDILRKIREGQLDGDLRTKGQAIAYVRKTKENLPLSDNDGVRKKV